MITSAKTYTKKKNKNQKRRTDRTLGQMVKAKLYRPYNTKKHTHTHSQKEKEEKYIHSYILKKKGRGQINKQIYQ